MHGRRLFVWAIPLVAASCNEPARPGAAAPATAEASAPAFTRSAEPSSSAEPAASGAPTETASAAAEPDPEDSATASTVEALPEVEIKTIGMHIGGGPNDRETKAPIRRAVQDKADSFRACFALVEDRTKGGTFGVDIRIPGEGGKAKIRDPRSGLKGDGVEECMVKAFESVEFERPPKGVPMMVSYSMRFTPK